MSNGPKETLIYEKLEDSKVRCGVCPRFCVVKDGERGFCMVRENRGGVLYSLVYGKAVSSAVDPVEKKPFFHFAPGSRALSVATVGCNLRCDFCQNYRISYGWEDVRGERKSPSDLVKDAKKYGCQGIAYTYTEPTVFLEYAHDTMLEAGDKLYNVFVSNGYMTAETVEKIAPHLDAINVDLKGGKEFYREHCQVPDPEPIYEALKELKRQDVHVEVTNLIIPDENDDEGSVRERVEWIKNNIGKETPLHFSRFQPHLELKDKRPTPVETLEKAIDVAKEEGMLYVYSGNVSGHESESTYCPECNQLVIKRRGFSIQEFGLEGGTECGNCGEKVHIAGEKWIPRTKGEGF